MENSVTNQFVSVSEQIQASFAELWMAVISALPEVVLALAVFILGLIIAPLLGAFARHLLSFVKIDALAERMGITESLRKMDFTFTISGLVGGLVKWFFIIAFLIAATDILGWDRVTEFLQEIVLYLPNVIVAVIIIAVGLIVGGFLEQFVTKGVHGSQLPVSNPKMLGLVAKYAVVTFAVLAALIQLGIAQELIQILFAGLVLAMALAFGLGGQDKARELLNRFDTHSGRQ